ncbi:hypothetical protein VQ02_24575 [Methylobacterium variabile]|uniref:IucA/IucC family siderophore biosynthesis protein n=1 Tax=Methylobacterium variabile TaxID=298794 RepID=A0A0J6SFG1_9HYPH|nr:IucA/IucC family protein [Methylobacterium variabile]KMO32083.1 hypothetical protein VQ02_24575 [Methylobacterium variabile]
MTTAPSDLPDAGSRSDAEILALSRRNAIRRLVRCLFAEAILDVTQLVRSPCGSQAWLPLPSRGAHLHFERIALAPARTVLVRGAVSLVGAGGDGIPVETPDLLLDLVRDEFDVAPSPEGLAGLKADVAGSIANDAAARRRRESWDRDLAERIRAAGETDLPGYLRRHADVRETAILLDQWGALEGHPFYPTWKARPGLSAAEVAALSPEFAARVPVRVAALRADMAHVETMPQVTNVHDWFASAFPGTWEAWRAGITARGLDPTGWLPLPVHGWHLDVFVREHFADAVAEGVLILDGPEIETAPSMSFRTMMPEGPLEAPFIKLPIALWMTSEQRSLQAKSIHMGPRNSAVIATILEHERGFGGRLAIYPEEVAYHYRHAVRRDDAPGRNLSVVFRAAAPAFAACEGNLHVPVAALFTALPDSGRPFVTALVGSGDPETFFRAYARTVVPPVVAIYLLYGVGLEAHQQNTSVVFDADGQALRILVRDFGDGRTFAPLLEARGLTLHPYTSPGILPTVFRGDIEPVRALVLNACFVCHLHEFALALTSTYGIPDARLWRILGEETEAAFAAVAGRVEPAFWAAEREAFLRAPWTARSLLRMHLSRYADYRLQHRLPNPLYPATHGP